MVCKTYCATTARGTYQAVWDATVGIRLVLSYYMTLERGIVYKYYGNMEYFSLMTKTLFDQWPIGLIKKHQKYLFGLNGNGWLTLLQYIQVHTTYVVVCTRSCCYASLHHTT